MLLGAMTHSSQMTLGRTCCDNVLHIDDCAVNVACHAAAARDVLMLRSLYRRRYVVVIVAVLNVLNTNDFPFR